MAYDILSISDLEATQLLNKHYAEVITSKEDGIASGLDITQTTNPITGVTRRTLYKILDDMDETFLERLLKMAFTPVGTFTEGATLTDARQILLWEVSKGGDGRYYSWSGSFGKSGKVVTAGSTPSPIKAGSWVDRTQETLREEIRNQNSYLLIPHLYTMHVVTNTDIDTTGAVDESKYIAGLLSLHRCIKLPEGRIKANISIPSDRCLIGSGMLKFDGADWVGNGTLIIGNVDASNKQRVSGGNFSVDAYALASNAVTALGVNTDTIYLKNVSTRANNHNYLFEQNGTDRSGESGGNIILEDCNASSGPNGFAIKMKNVTLIRCDSSRSTVQAYVCASDNINGAKTYSRAQNVTFIDCTGFENKTTLRCYARDHHSLTNKNGVYPASNIKWVRGKLFGCSEHAAHIGDFYESTPTMTRINCEDISILDSDISYNTLRGVIITLGTRIKVKGCRIGVNGDRNNIDFDTYGSRCIDLDITDNTYLGPVLGKESGVYTLTNGQSIINASHGMSIFKTANTSRCIISSIIGGRAGQKITLYITDEFTECNVGGKIVSGKGVIANYEYDSIADAWLCTEDRTGNERVIVYSPSLVLDFATGVTSGVYVGLNSTTTSVNLSSPPASHAGRLYTVRMSPANAGDKGISGWNTSVFKFSTSVPAPSVITYGTTQLITFFWDGARMIAVSSVNVS